jgi:hypothetical protein
MLFFRKATQMTKDNLKLIKAGKQMVKPKRSASILAVTAQEPLHLTPAEQIEVARFKALTMKRAAHRAKVARIVAKLYNSDQDVAA